MLREFGLKPPFSDAQIYIKVTIVQGVRRIVMLPSTRADDLKGCNPEAEAKLVVVHMERSIGGMTQEMGTFTHTGIEHQQCKNGSMYTHQGAFAAQLRPIDVSNIKGKLDEDLVSDELN